MPRRPLTPPLPIDMPNLAREIEMMTKALQHQSATMAQHHQVVFRQLETTRVATEES